MAADPSARKAISALTKSAGFARRVQSFTKLGKKLIRQNEQDILITDEARVLAEIIVRGRRAVPRTFWSRQALGTTADETTFFGAKSSPTVLDETNLPLEGEFERDQIFFAKEFGAYLDPDMSQADRRLLVQDHVFELRVNDRPIIQEKLRNMPGGGGLDGELNNGIPEMSNVLRLPFFIRIPPGKKIDAIVKQLSPLTGPDTELELFMRGILGERK